jgi:hypothetical protein
MKLPFIKFEKGLELIIDYGNLSLDDIMKVKEVLNSPSADFKFMNDYRMKGKKDSLILGFSLPFLTKDQYHKLKGL